MFIVRLYVPHLGFIVTCAVDWAASCWHKQCNSERPNFSYTLMGTRCFSSKDNSNHGGHSHSRDNFNQSDVDGKCSQSDIDETSDGDTSDTTYSDHEIFEAFQSELTLDDDNEEREAKASQRASHSAHLSQEEPLKDELGKKPWNRKERVKACLDKLKRGPDGRYINVFEVATEVDMLIASYLKLRAQDDPSLAENSDDDEKLLEGIDIEKFKRLQKRLRDGTYEFQPIVQVPLPKKKIVKRKTKKVKKQHAF